MPPAALISSMASCEACTTEGATTLLAPLKPTAVPMTTGSLASADALAPASAMHNRRLRFVMFMIPSAKLKSKNKKAFVPPQGD